MDEIVFDRTLLDMEEDERNVEHDEIEMEER